MKKIVNIIAIISLAGLFGSCEMNYYPYDNIEQSQAFRSVDDIGKLINGSYQQIRSISYGNYSQPMDIQTDLFNASSSFGNRLGGIHGWTLLTASTYEIEYPWRDYYKLIANLNNILDNYQSVTPKENETETYNRYVGEAYFMRAYAYSYLINLYAKAYNSSTASSDLGVPLNLKYDIEAKLPRSSIEDVYNQIFKDLEAAENAWKDLSWSNVKKYKESPSKFTPDAVTALKARLYLNRGEWADAIAQAEKIINANTYPLLTAKDALAAMWETDAGSEIITHLAIAADEGPNANSAYLTSHNASTDYYTPDYIPQKWVYDLYDAADFRKEVYFKNFTIRLATGDFNDVYLLNKYPLTRAFNASGNFWHSPILFRTAELYLIVAEAGARGNNSTLALQRLNELRTARGLSFLSGLSDDTLFEEVKKERVRELLAEGTRLTDLKRWNMGFTRSTPQNVNTITSSFSNLSVKAGDNKFVWAIPSRDMNLNSNLKGQQNQGW